MANRISPYLVGTTCEVRIDGVLFMFGQNVSLQDAFNNQITYGLGDYGGKTNEPIQYNGGTVSMASLKYTDAALGINGETLSGKTVQAVLNEGSNKVITGVRKQAADGNSILFVNSISPEILLFEKTSDIIVYAKYKQEGGDEVSVPVYKALDCLLQSYNENNGAAQLSQCNYQFRARLIQDVSNEPDKQANNA